MTNFEKDDPVHAPCMSPWCGLDGEKCGSCKANEYTDALLTEYKKLREALRKPVCSCCQAALDQFPIEE